MNKEIIIINGEPFYRIPNGTSYDYAPIPKEFKPYFEKLQQENEQLKHNWYSLKMYLKEKAKPFSDFDNYDVERIINKMEELEALKRRIK